MVISSLLFIWIKALHIIAVISWMAGLLYLPRLFIYHCESGDGTDKSETFKIMERRLLFFIMNPAMIISFITGGLMIYFYGYFILTETWLIVKIGCLFILLVTHILMVKWCKDFEIDNNQKTQIFFRVINEVPTILMVVIIIMVVVKPF
jgi:putative membrane protein